MSKEDPHELAAFIDARRLGITDNTTDAEREKAAQEAWRADNLVAHEQVKTAFEGLAFDGVIADYRELLGELPTFRDNKMAVRTLSWIPDVSQATREAAGPHIRAVYGQAVLLTEHYSGVEGDVMHVDENVDSVFYALGIAVQTGESIDHFHMFGPGVDTYNHQVYGGLSQNKYAEAIRNYNNVEHNEFMRSTHLPTVESTMQGVEIPADVLEEYQRQQVTRNVLARGRAGSFRRKMREIGETPTESPAHEFTQAMNALLLPAPPEKEGNFMSRLWPARRKSIPEATYVGRTQPMYSWNRDIDRLNAAQTFETFLLTNPAITGKK